jgi:hypothetical protein
MMYRPFSTGAVRIGFPCAEADPVNATVAKTSDERIKLRDFIFFSPAGMSDDPTALVVPLRCRHHYKQVRAPPWNF